MNYPNFMQVWRKRAKLSQWEMAQKLHCSQTDVSNYETGKEFPPIEVREEICRILGKPLDVLFPDERS